MKLPISLTKKRLFIGGGVVLLLLSAWLFFGNKSSTEKSQRVVVVETGTIEDVVTSQGKLEPKDYVDVGLQVSGRINKLYVDVGDNVAKNQLLAELDPRIYQSKLEADEAHLNSLQAQAEEQQAGLKLAKQQQARNNLMIKNNAISKDAFDQGAAALSAAQAKLKSLQAQIDEINSTLKADRTNLEYTKIYAPMDGTVATLPVRVGQSLNAVQSSPTIMRVANLDVMTVRAQVAEADIMRLKAGMPVYFTTLGDLEHKFHGKVRQIQPSPEIINDVVLFNVLIDAENKERLLMDGMSTQIFFILGKAEKVPLLPLEALGKRQSHSDNAQGKAYLVQTPSASNLLTIYTGIADRTQIEIKSGLKNGDKVIVPSREKTVKKPSGMGPGGGGPKL